MGRKSRDRLEKRNRTLANRLQRRPESQASKASEVVRIPGKTLTIQVPIKDKIVGFAVSPVNQTSSGQTLAVQVRGSIGVDDGEILYDALRSIGATFLNKACSQLGIPTDTLSGFAVVIKAGVATVYLNPSLHLRIAFKGEREIKHGEVVTDDDIADIERVRFKDFEVPPDAGLIAHFRVAWRPVLYFDFGPQQPEPQLRHVDYDLALGALYAQTAYHYLFRMEPELCERMFSDGWFPFVRLLPGRFRNLLRAFKSNGDPGSSIDAVLTFCSVERLERWSTLWFTRAAIAEHQEFIVSALRSYRNNDFIAAVATLYPRIEGILRSLEVNTKGHSQGALAARIETVAAKTHPHANVRLPTLFKKYLTSFYFRNFSDTDAPISRNSVAHGVAEASAHTKQKALIGFLIIDQVAFVT